jgi:hypothetical protein
MLHAAADGRGQLILFFLFKVIRILIEQHRGDKYNNNGYRKQQKKTLPELTEFKNERNGSAGIVRI